jgi:hypothetical protein
MILRRARRNTGRLPGTPCRKWVFDTAAQNQEPAAKTLHRNSKFYTATENSLPQVKTVHRN